MKRLILPAIILPVIFLASCYYDNEEALYPTSNIACDTTSVTFSGSITPILSSNCWGCHSNANAASFGNNIRVESYTDVSSQINLIIPAIKHTGSLPFMPKNVSKLSDCSIAKFDIWIRSGMPNN